MLTDDWNVIKKAHRSKQSQSPPRKRGPSDFLNRAHKLDPRFRGDDTTLLIADFLTNAARDNHS